MSPDTLQEPDKLILWLDQATPDHAPQIGGKAAGLVELIQAGLPVPPGFCITTAAYERFAKANGVLPAEATREVAAAFEQLGGPVAVRSSAVTEDGFETSFAGQQETVLNVARLDQLLSAIAQCYGSLFSRRATLYRRRMGMTGDLSMALLVQRMVPATAGGVAFTADPVTGQAEDVLIEASAGLGDRVMGGQIAPERWRVSRSGGQPQREAAVEPAVLTPEQALSIAGVALQAEAARGGPQDVEWALAEGRVWLLQSRPITTPGQAWSPERIAREERRRLAQLTAEAGGLCVWANSNMAEVLPSPSPMAWSLARQALSFSGPLGRAMDQLGIWLDETRRQDPVVVRVAGRVYLDLRRMGAALMPGLPIGFDLEAMRADPMLANYPIPKLLAHPAALLLKPWLLPRILRMVWRTWRQLRTARREFEARASRQAAEFEAAAAACDPLTMDPSQLMDLVFEEMMLFGETLVADCIRLPFLAMLAFGAMHRLLRAALGEEEGRAMALRLTSGLQDNLTLEMDFDLWRVAVGELPLRTFLERYGHRGAGELDPSRPRWSEDPQQLENVIQRLRETSGLNPVERHKHRQAQRQAAERELEQRLRKGLLDKLLPFRRWAVLYAVRLAQSCAPLRELPKHYMLRGMAAIRRIALSIGERTGLGEDIFFLDLLEIAEALGGADLAGLARERRRQQLAALRVPLPRVIFSDDLEAIGRLPEVEVTSELHGIPAGAGVARGPACVLTDPVADSSPAEGEILVIPTADPGWTPHFLPAAAVVMEVGGVLCHAAVVAREYGLPTVVAVEQASRVISPGQVIEVDGTHGVVRVLSEAQRGRERGAGRR